MERCTRTIDAFEPDDDDPEAWAARRAAERVEHQRALWREQGARKRAKKKAAREAAANPAANPGPRAEQDDRQLTLAFA